MQKIKRTIAVTTLSKKDGTEKLMVGNFNVMKEVKSGWRVEGTRMWECEMPLDKFFSNAESKVPVEGLQNGEEALD